MTPLSSPSNESNFRTAAYEALSSYIQNAPGDVLHVVRQVIQVILQRMEALLAMSVRAPCLCKWTVLNRCLEPIARSGRQEQLE